MTRSIHLLLVGSLAMAAAGLSSCGKKDSGGDTNIVEMNASDGSMNDMTAVESATLDQAGAAAAAAENGAAADNAVNAM
ncbi:hypothetical protein GG804_01125 [Sphingomonas histidinilytica]|jgi:hypothetical protein|uniref:Circumsporozoite protein n=1 Tax=Rhizorhabdus histidinilytica TaxID=439228 RepID=A0A1T5C3H0_9SPHN|nr:hypothetical protein [Rhizorhabdus histidinilytica]MBO9375360.1 hypothetical protein [Rhizorhabdus histidinilytica]QEH77274.1 hypothetical protein EIK56_03460 [Sphingomonas sp. C8-2]SKB53951.1 hypothetical protein SAMN06295920_103554 [Rhizorhabdus histidinilytica]